MQNPLAIYAQLAKKTPLPFHIPVLESECSKMLRSASVRHIIFEVICKEWWRPFLSEYLLEKTPKHKVITDIYAQLEAEGDQVQRHWKISTLKSLKRLDDGVDFKANLEFHVGGIADFLRPLLDDRQVTQCQADLRQIFTKAIEIGKVAERDQCPVQFSCSPSSSDSEGWEECFVNVYDEGEMTPPASPPSEQQQLPFYVTPKIYRPATAARAEEVICAGRALFPSTGIFQSAQAEWDSFRRASRQAAMNIGRDRRMSADSTTMAPPNWWSSGTMNGPMVNGGILMKV